MCHTWVSLLWTYFLLLGALDSSIRKWTSIRIPSLIALVSIKNIEANRVLKSYCDLRRKKKENISITSSRSASYREVRKCLPPRDQPGRPPTRVSLSAPLPMPKGSAQTLTDAEDHLRNSPWTRGVSQLQGLPRDPVHVPARPYQPRPGKHATAPAVFKWRVLRWRGRLSGCCDGRGLGGGGGLRRHNDLGGFRRLGKERTHVEELGLSRGSFRENWRKRGWSESSAYAPYRKKCEGRWEM